MNTGRPIAKWTSRRCTICKELKPRRSFEIMRAVSKTGKTTLGKCADCRRRIDLSRKFEQYHNDPEYKARQLERNRIKAYHTYNADQRAKNCYYQGRWQWIERRMARIAWWDDQPIIICVKPSGRLIRSNEKHTERTGMELAIVRDRAPVNLPIGWRPILRAKGPIITKHPSCPTEWEWMEFAVEKRYPKWRQKANEDAGANEHQP